jgi:SLT domain-containing protein
VSRRAKALGAAAVAVFAASQISHAARPSAPSHHAGHVSKWISEAVKVMKANGVPASELNGADIALIIRNESGGNPDAVNTTDSNAAAGHPSRGLAQTTPATFSAYCLPGYCSDITDPVSNIIAGVRYALARYGSLDNVPGVVAVRDGLPYVGY